jgi:chorismate--pyruvate lyase
VQLLGQGDARAFASESAGLGLVNHRLALVREVSLSNGTVPLVLARTIMPPEARRGKHSVLAKLGNRPLGEFLFTQRTLRRPRLEFARVPPEDWLPSIAQDYGLNKTIWGRRSLYEIDTVSLLVCEFFLPAVLNL